ADDFTSFCRSAWTKTLQSNMALMRYNRTDRRRTDGRQIKRTAAEVSEPSQQDRVPPPTTSPRSLPTRPAPSEQHVVQIASQHSEADVLAVFRRLQQEQPTLFSQATLSRIDLGPQSYSARVGPFASEKDCCGVPGPRSR